MRTSAPLLLAASLAVVSCSGGGTESPRPTSMDPSHGAPGAPVPVVIHGDGFLVRPSESQSGGGAAVDTRHRAWLDGVELDAVTWIDFHTLQAIVPAGLPDGPKQLVVENALGERGSLDAAYTVGPTHSALVATLAAQPATVTVGQPTTVTLSVRNAGGSPVTALTPSALTVGGVGGANATISPPSPASVAQLAPGASATFTWTVTPARPGPLTFSAGAHGVDGLTSADVTSAAAGASGEAQAPAQLTATVASSRASVNTGQAVTVTLTLTNGGASTANLTGIAPATTGSTTAATCGTPIPAPAPLGAGGTATYTWTCTASAAGTLSLSGTATGTDAVSGGALSATPATPATVAVQTKATLTASLAIQGNPTTVQLGQALSVTLTVSDTGQASATLTSVQPTATPTTGASCAAAAPAPPQSVTATGPRTFTWTCTPLVAGPVTLGAAVSGTDDNSSAAVQATAPGVPVTVQAPVSLTVTIATDRATADVGQKVNATFTITNGGPTSATITAVAVNQGGTATATCTNPSPSSATIASGSSRAFTWSCTASTSGTLILNGTATGTVSGSPISPQPTAATPATVTVQIPAALSAAIAVDATLVNAGTTVNVTLTVTDAGGATADVTAVNPQRSGTATATCTAATPAVSAAAPAIIAGGGTATFSWTCTPTTAGTLIVNATVSGTDANTGATLTANANPGATVNVIPPGSLAVGAFTASPATVDQGQPVNVTLTLNNGSATPASIASVTPAMSPATGTTCSAPAPAAPLTIAGGASTVFTWTCSASVAGAYTVGATVVSTPALAVAPVAIPVTVQTPAALTATLTPSAAPYPVSSPITLTLALQNTGQASALVGSITPTSNPGGNNVTGCVTVTPALPQTIAGLTTTTFTWSCTPTKAATTYTFGATIGTTTDVNTGATLTVTVPTVTVTSS